MGGCGVPWLIAGEISLKLIHPRKLTWHVKMGAPWRSGDPYSLEVQRPLNIWSFRKDDIVLVRIYFINNSRGLFGFNGLWLTGYWKLAVLSDEQMSNGWPFSLLNDEQMSNWVGGWAPNRKPSILGSFLLVFGRVRWSINRPGCKPRRSEETLKPKQCGGHEMTYFGGNQKMQMYGKWKIPDFPKIINSIVWVGVIWPLNDPTYLIKVIQVENFKMFHQVIQFLTLLEVT